MSIEMPTQRAARLMVEIEASKQNSYSKGEVKTILNSIAGMSEDQGCRSVTAVSEIRRGDVFIAKLVGGKTRPWVVLSAIDNVVRALALTSGESTPFAAPSKCRLWPNTWFGNSLALFDADRAMAEVSRPYTNLRHLSEIEAAVLALYSAQGASPQVVSLADIRGRLRA